MKRIPYFLPLLLLALAALACRAAERALDRSADAVETVPRVTEQIRPPTEVPSTVEGTTPDAGATATPPPAETEAGEGEAPLPAGRPPQSQGAEIRPPELRAQLTRLSDLIGFQVLGQGGAVLGVVSDFILNTCETYIIYFLLDPAEQLGLSAGSRLVIPYEAVTINSGALDAQSGAIELSLSAGWFSEAPVFPESQELVPVDWEAGVRDYWSQAIRLSNLTTGCRVAAPGGGTTEIHKVAYASDLIGAELRDGLQNALGRVEEAIVEPESGKVSFFVISLEDGLGLVLIPLRVVNIPGQAFEPGNEIWLVLLVENGVLLNAPKINTAEEAVNLEAQGAARQYWDR